MKTLLAGAFVLFGSYLALNNGDEGPANYRQTLHPPANADAAMTPDSGTSGIGSEAE